ncbi:thermonuclease family protein [Planctomycetota bacterium]
MNQKLRPNQRQIRRRPLSRRQRRLIGSAAVIALLGLFLAGRLNLLPKPTPTDRARYHNKIFTVVNVVDGDTLDLGITDGRERYTRVRLWGVDTPETKHPEMGVMYYGPEAAEFTREMVLNKEVLVVLEPFEDTRGLYGRLLAYIYLPDEKDYNAQDKAPPYPDATANQTLPRQKMLNEELIMQGFGYADDRFRHMFRDRFTKLQKEAQEENRGLWKDVKPQQWPQWYRKRQEKNER